MALAGVLAGTAQRHTVINRAVITNFGGLAKDDAHTVVDEQLAANLRAGVNLNAGQVPRQLADQPRQKKALMIIQKMCNLMRYQHMKAGVQDNNLRHIACGGVLIADIFCIFPKAHSPFLFTLPYLFIL